MPVQLLQEAQQLDGLQEVRIVGGQRMLLAAGLTDVLLVCVVLRTPARTGAGTKPVVQGKEKHKEACLNVQCHQDGRTHAMCPNGTGTWICAW